jgi:hypothetical protein
MLGDFPRDCLVGVISGSFDADEGDTVGTGDSAKAHDLSLVAVVAAAAARPCAHLSQNMEYGFSIVR